MANTIELKLFRDVPLSDPFFDNLKREYKEFADWFLSKADEPVYVQYADEQLIGFMYLKLEEGEVDDVSPVLTSAKWVKIGTLKVEAHGTRLGERLIKKAFDYSIVNQADGIYVTVFAHHTPLISMLEEFGFRKKSKKETKNGVEDVFVKSFNPIDMFGEIRKDYPLIDTRNVDYYLLAIRPQWHTQLFPDSLLKTDSYDLLSDVTHTNSITKNYICAMSGIEELHRKDIVVIYRTTDNQGPAEYHSVATSVCVVEEIRGKNTFDNINDYLSYTLPYSVFTETGLKRWWYKDDIFVLKMLYNAAFTKRVIRKELADDVGLERSAYWGFLPLSRTQFFNIIELGGVDERLIIR